MSWTQDIHESLSAWRKYQDGLKTLRKMSDQKPAATAFAFDIVAQELQSRALVDLYHYGVTLPQARYARRLEKLEDPQTEAEKEALFYETYYQDRKRYEELAAQGYFDVPKEKEELLRRGSSLNIDEELRSTLAAMQHATYRMARYRMHVAGEKSRAVGQGYYGSAVCEAFLETCEQFPVIFAGVVQEKRGGDVSTRQRAAASLTAWVRSGISLSFPRLKAALESERGISAFKRIYEVLPGAVLVEWAALERTEPLAALVTRSAFRLEKEGDQASRPHQERELVVQEREEQGTDEPELEEFKLREELLALKGAAKLTDQEHQVLQLTLEGYLQRTIAEKLGVTVGAVKKVKSRARTKLKQVAGQ